MKLLELVRLLWKHKFLLILTPVLTAVVVIFLTRNPSYTYTSETTLYTGMASAGGLDLFSSLDYYKTNTSFDNFTNIFKTRETQQDVAIRLLAEHLMMERPDPAFISENSFNELQDMVPDYIRNLVVKSADGSNCESDSSTTIDPNFPSYLNKSCFDKTVQNLKDCMVSNDTNFVYKLLNYNHPHYSLDAVSRIMATRMESSDLIRLRYESDDPGICQQVLVFYTQACIINYQKIKENRSVAVVDYFEKELEKAKERLQEAENQYLKYSENNSIINFAEQTKTASTSKDNLDNQLNQLKIKLAGAEAAIKRIEEKLNDRGNIIIRSTSILNMRNRLAIINAKIATAETVEGEATNSKDLSNLKAEANKLKQDIQKTVDDLYSASNTVEGLSTEKLLDEWITNVIVYEETKAAIRVQERLIRDYKDQYEQYAQSGSDIKRLERDISVAEQSYLSMLQGLNQARIKIQDSEMSGTIKTVDPPYYPLTPNPTKRKILVLAAAIFGFLLILTFILALEYFDSTLKNTIRTSKKTGLDAAGVYPLINKPLLQYDLDAIVSRILDTILQNIGILKSLNSNDNRPKTLILWSTSEGEGKSEIGLELAKKLKYYGKSTLYFHPSTESILKEEMIGYNLDSAYYSANSYMDLMGEIEKSIHQIPDYVIVELPSILKHQYPVVLMAKSDVQLLVCSANTIWSSADAIALKGTIEVTGKNPKYVLNGVDVSVLESIIGELPKERGFMERWIKRLFRF